MELSADERETMIDDIIAIRGGNSRNYNWDRFTDEQILAMHTEALDIDRQRRKERRKESSEKIVPPGLRVIKSDDHDSEYITIVNYPSGTEETLPRKVYEEMYPEEEEIEITTPKRKR